MAFFTANTSIEAIKESGGGGKFISTSGIYPVTINFISVTTNDSNARSLNFNVNWEGNPCTLYGLTLDNNDGTANFKQAIFNKLCIIAGIEVVSDPEVETHNVGKDNTPTEFLVLSDFSGLEVQIKVKQTYNLWNGKLQSNLDIERFYSAEGATAEEILNDTEKGIRLKKDLEYAEDITYKDNLTTEKVAELKKAAEKAAKQASSTGAAQQSSQTPSVKAVKNPFGQ